MILGQIIRFLYTVIAGAYALQWLWFWYFQEILPYEKHPYMACVGLILAARLLTAHLPKGGGGDRDDALVEGIVELAAPPAVLLFGWFLTIFF